MLPVVVRRRVGHHRRLPPRDPPRDQTTRDQRQKRHLPPRLVERAPLVVQPLAVAGRRAAVTERASDSGYMSLPSAIREKGKKSSLPQ